MAACVKCSLREEETLLGAWCDRPVRLCWGWGVQMVSIMSDMMPLALSLMREITVSHTVSGSTDKSSARHAGARRWYVDKCREFTLLIDTKRGKRSHCRETSVENNAREQKGGIWREREVSDVHCWHGMSFSVFAFRHHAMIRAVLLWGCQPLRIDTEANERMIERLYKQALSVHLETRLR